MASSALAAETAFCDWRDITLRDLTILNREDATIAHVCAAKDKRALAAAAIHGAFGVPPPEKPECVTTEAGVTIVWAGPEQWLVIADGRDGRDLEAELTPLLKGLAAVTDQSDARVIVRVQGSHARALLAKGVPVDLDAHAFPARGAVLTHASHIGVILWQIDDRPTYELAVFRSFADSFGIWVRSAAAEWGYARARGAAE
jgi:heterotetrameric sarcosine oxidase gamma subunit